MIQKTQDTTARVGRARFFGFGPLNFGLLAAGLVAILAGYVLLAGGSTVAAPLLLMLGYAVLVPAGLLVGLRASTGTAADGGE